MGLMEQAARIVVSQTLKQTDNIDVCQPRGFPKVGAKHVVGLCKWDEIVSFLDEHGYDNETARRWWEEYEEAKSGDFRDTSQTERLSVVGTRVAIALVQKELGGLRPDGYALTPTGVLCVEIEDTNSMTVSCLDRYDSARLVLDDMGCTLHLVLTDRYGIITHNDFPIEQFASAMRTASGMTPEFLQSCFRSLCTRSIVL